MKQLAFDYVAPALPTLDNFIVGRNAEAVQRLRGLAQSRGGERSTYIWGAAASGRTHLLRGTLAAMQRSGARVAYVAGGAEPLPPGLDEVDAAAIDDVERLGDREQGAIFNLYNRLREAGGTLLAAGNAPPGQLSLRADVVTRLAWGLVYEVHALSDSEKAHAIAEHAALRGFGLPPEVTQYLMTRVQRDMRTLIAMLDALDRYSLETKRPVTLPLVRELLAADRMSARQEPRQ